MINLKFLVRDADITYYDEWHYICITLWEVLKILIINFNTYLKNNYKKL